MIFWKDIYFSKA